MIAYSNVPPSKPGHYWIMKTGVAAGPSIAIKHEGVPAWDCGLGVPTRDERMLELGYLFGPMIPSAEELIVMESHLCCSICHQGGSVRMQQDPYRYELFGDDSRIPLCDGCRTTRSLTSARSSWI